MSKSSIRPIDRVPSGVTTFGLSGSGSDSNERVLRIPQSSSITGSSPSDCLISYTGHWFVGWYNLSAEKQLVYSTAPADWAAINGTKSVTIPPSQSEPRSNHNEGVFLSTKAT